MSDRHLSEADLAESGAFAEDDERRRHLESCAECRMLRARYAEFVAGPVDAPAADVADAERRLGQMLEREIQRSVRDPGTTDGFRPRATRQAWAMPALAAAAAVMIVAGAFIFARRPGVDERPSGVLRGGPGAAPAVELVEATPASGDAIELRWRAVSGADRYSVRLYSGELRELAALESADTTLRVARGSLAAAAPGDTVLWRVTAMRGGAPLARSVLGTARVP
jgi:predicted ester cyclase